MDDQLQSISAKISSIVDSAPNKTVLGVRLGIMLRNSFPNFSPWTYQCRNLRQFIRTHVPGVIESGRSGADVVYAAGNRLPLEPEIQSPAPTIPARGRGDFVPLPTSTFVWKAYSNPSHPFNPAVNKETGDYQVVAENSLPDAPWVLISKPSTDVHREIATEFLSTLSGHVQTVLSRELQDSKWYVHFSDTAKRHGVGLAWATFRRTKLIARFTDSLREIGAPPVPLAHFHGTTHAPVVPHVLATGQRPVAGDEAAFRDLVARLIAELPISEVRALRLPVGVVFDALKR